MKRLFSIAVLLAAQFLTSAACAAGAQSHRLTTAAESEIQSALLALERQRAGAILRRDTAVLRALMDRQYYHVESRGRVRSKTDLLTAIERDDIHFRVYETESTEIQVLDGGVTAIVTGIFRSQLAAAGSKLFRGRYVRVWVRQPDGWKNTSHQTTEIRPAQDNCQCD
ncbi:nuclear transport factor 2 family protein [Telluria aromaticivorans]|uniref:Nuclear transport factor 2 family protein n=1 Tax=Telluria aromaticivorans TaxID=2725995 RepID=A0A7Y2JW41_9BURK|nr:nuclear transport factor 2 family protein [Telluria aromaticivorans]NNG22117.1 nuclear transport factor 2 family protein [Telluria aromaticivorans]